ncbi:hypothetical protein ACJA23_03245 [Mycoplasma corogypsi]|uniref:hypothetical protein n=1 Tax=Mycoplasma corogypsi TaxID=2106 RepID=UPI0038737A6E
MIIWNTYGTKNPLYFANGFINDTTLNQTGGVYDNNTGIYVKGLGFNTDESDPHRFNVPDDTAVVITLQKTTTPGLYKIWFLGANANKYWMGIYSRGATRQDNINDQRWLGFYTFIRMK